MTIPSYQVNGTSAGGEHLTLTMDFYTLTTSVNIVPTGNLTDAAQKAFDQLIKVISLNGQPVILGTPASDGNGHYVMKFAIDHTGSWTQASTLVSAIQANTPSSMGFAADASLAVTISSSM